MAARCCVPNQSLLVAAKKTVTHAQWQVTTSPLSPTNNKRKKDDASGKYVFSHLAEAALLSCWGHDGRPFWALLGCFGELRGNCLVGLVFTCLESMTGSSYGRARMENISEKLIMIYIQTCCAAVSRSQITTVCWLFNLLRPVAMVASKEKTQMLNADSVWQLRVSFHRALQCCVVVGLCY